MPAATSTMFNSSFSTASTSVASCKTCGDAIDQPAAMVQDPFYCSKRCEQSLFAFPSPAGKNLSAFHITHEDIEVFSGIKTLAFAEEYKKRLGFIQAWATAETELSIYTMDLAPWKDMLDHENVSQWPNPRNYHTYALETAYNMAHHDECDGLYMEACTSLLGSIIRVFLMWDITQLGISRSKLAGVCLDMNKNTFLRGEDVITVPDELLDTELLQVAWAWPGAIDAAIDHARFETNTTYRRNGHPDHHGTFDFDRSHWKSVIEVIRKVSGSVWEH